MRNNSFSEILTNTKTEFVFRNNKKTYLEPGNGFQLRYGKFVKWPCRGYRQNFTILLYRKKKRFECLLTGNKTGHGLIDIEIAKVDAGQIIIFRDEFSEVFIGEISKSDDDLTERNSG